MPTSDPVAQLNVLALRQDAVDALSRYWAAQDREVQAKKAYESAISETKDAATAQAKAQTAYSDAALGRRTE